VTTAAQFAVDHKEEAIAAGKFAYQHQDEIAAAAKFGQNLMDGGNPYSYPQAQTQAQGS
jgi:hypothetical protein